MSQNGIVCLSCCLIFFNDSVSALMFMKR